MVATEWEKMEGSILLEITGLDKLRQSTLHITDFAREFCQSENDHDKGSGRR